MIPSDYEYLCKLLRGHSGLDLSADKQYLIESRLLPLARKAGLSGISELVQKMKGGSDAIIVQVVEAVTTNETFFFRDKVPFDHFRDSIMPEILRARAGRKSRQTGELWQINADVRAMVQHRQLNLLHDFSQLGVFDVIFCRNVLIYFDQDTKINIFNRLAKATEPDGFLVLGAAETVVGLTDVFKPCPEWRGLYRPIGTRAAPTKAPAFGVATPKFVAMAGL